MNRTAIAVLGLSLTLAPLAAQAHGWHHDRDDDDDGDEQVQVAPPPAQPGGHYEWRSVSQWVPAHREAMLVPGVCRVHPWWHRVVCRPSRYVQRWVPGRYVQSGQWVWIPEPVQPYPQDPDDAYPQPYPEPPQEQAPQYQEPQDQEYPQTPSGYELDGRGPGVNVQVHLAADPR